MSWSTSFWIGTFWMVTSGLAASNALMALLNTVSSVPVVALFHQTRVTFFPLTVAAGL